MLAEDKQILWRASAALLGVALPTIIIGKALMFALLGLGLLAGLFATKDESLRATVKLMLNSWITVLVLAMLAVMMVGVWTGINPGFAFDKWLQMVLVTVCACTLFVVLREMPGRHLESLLKALAIATLVMATAGVIDALAGDPRISTLLHGPDKALTPYRLNAISSALAVLLPFVWARLLLKSREGEPFAMRVALPLSAFGLMAALICGGRAGWVGLVVSLSVFAYLAGRYHSLVIHKKHWLGAGLVVVAGMLLYALAFGWEFMVSRASIVGEVGIGRGMLSGRPEVWAVAFKHLLDAPIFGIGMMNYRNLPDAIDMHPHNWLLQLLLETGILGTGLFLGLVGLLMTRFVTFAKGNLYGVAASASVAGFLIAGLANTSIFNLWWLTYLVFVSILGWRAGWGGDDLKQRRRGKVIVKPAR